MYSCSYMHLAVDKTMYNNDNVDKFQKHTASHLIIKELKKH